MKKTSLISYFAVGLLVLNVFLIAFIVYNRGNRPDKNKPRNSVIAKLHLDEAQIAAYDVSIEAHHKIMRSIDEQILSDRKTLYNTLQASGDTTLKDSLIRKIAAEQMLIEHANYQHFQEIKTLCKAEQQKDFNNFVMEVTHIFPNLNKKRPK